MAIHFDLVTLDSGAPDDLARFWAAALDLVEVEREDVDRWIVLGTRDGLRRLGIQMGTVRPGSMHLDLSCTEADFDSEMNRLLDLGAHLVGPARREAYGWIVNLTDPDGNPVDICAYF